jgi:N-methylhydantoinase B
VTHANVPNAVGPTILAGKLQAVVEDMAAIMSSSARSPIISSGRRFGCALIHAEADVVATDNPEYLGSLGAITSHCAQAFRFDLAPDDVLVTNDPYGGSPTVHHFAVVAPFVLQRRTAGYVTVLAHIEDIGGMVRGNYDPTAREARTEGVRFTPIRLVRFGRSRRDVVETLALNSRAGETFAGDLEAMLAAVRVGQRGVERLAAGHGPETLLTAMREVIAYSERRMRTALGKLPEGSYNGEVSLRVGGDELTVRANLTRSAGTTKLDLSHSDPQAPYFVNCVPSLARTHAILPLVGLVGEPLPWNSGILNAVEFDAGDATVVAPTYPHPTGWSLEHMGREVSEAVRSAVAAASPVHAGPGWPSACLAFTVRRERRIGQTEEQLAMTDLGALVQAGSSAAHGVDGWGQPGPKALGHAPSVEEFEMQTELMVKELEYCAESAGAGRWHGAPGVRAVILFPEVCYEHLYAIAPSGQIAGICGAAPGAAGSIELVEGPKAQQLTGIVTNRLLSGGAEVRIQTSAGGGFGEPTERIDEANGGLRDDRAVGAAARAGDQPQTGVRV